MTTNSDREFYLGMDNVEVESVQKITYAVSDEMIEVDGKVIVVRMLRPVHS